jgi:colanic acid/amylovoran biosynthesis glycosyltransferase
VVAREAPLRVAVVVGRFPVLSETFVLHQVLGLLDLDVDVHVFAAAPPPNETLELGNAARHALQGRVHVRSMPGGGGPARWLDMLRRIAALGDRAPLAVRALATLRRRGEALSPHAATLLDLVEHGPFQVVQAHFGDSGRVCAALPGSAARLVTAFHGYDANVAPRMLGSRIYDGLFARGDAFTANSRFLQSKLMALGCPPERLHVLPMGVDTHTLRFEPRRAPAPGERMRLLCVARLVEAKGIVFVIEAVASLVARGIDASLLVVGEGPERAALETRIAALQLADRVQLTGGLAVEQVHEAYRQAHAFVLASIRGARGDEEAQGLVVQEAQACGLPVVVSDIGGIAEGIAPGRSGLVFTAGDSEALCAALAELYARREEWGAMGAIGRRLVEDRFSRTELDRQLVSLYRDLIATGSAPPPFRHERA